MKKPLFGFLLFGSVLVAGAQEIKLDWLPSGAMKKIGYYRPTRLTLTPTRPEGIKVMPADVQAPLYGKLQLGPAGSPTTFMVVLDEPAGKPARIFVDANGNGDLTDDAPVEWKPSASKSKEGQELTMYSGDVALQMSYGAEKEAMHLGMYRFDKHDPARTSLTNFLFYYRDYARAGEVSLGGKTYQAMLVDDIPTGSFQPSSSVGEGAVLLFLDLNNNGKFEHGESFDATKPFNIGGTTYEIAGLTPSGNSFQIVKSSKTVEETKPRPSLMAGTKALPFQAKTTDGATIHFPESYKGKLVMLDFWATWCGPCRGELPYLTKAYAKYHGQGFEVLGVSLDEANDTEKLAKFIKENNMSWPEIYDGKAWKAAVAQQYFIESIPHPYLVDGNTGTIVAEGESLRGDQLAATLDVELAKYNAQWKRDINPLIAPTFQRR